MSLPNRSQSLFAVMLLACTAALSGCAMNLTMPTSSAVTAGTTAALPGIQGSNYGGHAPLVGAHVYVVQPGTTGYGSQVTSLLGPAYNTNTLQTGGSLYATTKNGNWTGSGGNATDQFVPTSFYGVTTDKNGEFNITGDYSCVANQPVMLIAYGGAPSYLGAGPNVYTVATQELYADGTGYWFTYTTSSPSPQLFYVGESVSVTGNPGGSAGFNATGTVLASGKHSDGTAAPLSTTSFSFYLPYSAYPNGGLNIPNTTTPSFAPSAATGVIATATPTFNPAAVNMAMLGICPTAQTVATITGAPQGTSSNQLSGISASDIAKLVVGQQILGPGVGPGGVATTITAINSATGTITMAALDTGPSAPPYTTSYSYTISASTFGPSSTTPIKYVYMNEISTTAVAYAMNQYANWSATSQTGNDEFHIGAPNTTQAQQGIVNAALTAGLLYDITGGNVALNNPDGDVHIARAVTPNGGNGTVPQTSLNMVGNILAACVDSANTVVAPAGSLSPSCQQLNKYAQDNGVLDTTVTTHQAANIAQAALYIAHYPQGNGTGTTSAGVQTVTAGTAATASAFANALYNIPTGNIPFTPQLGAAPTDFSMAIQWSNANANGGTAVGYNDVQVDSKGNVWTPSPNGATAQVFQFTPSGAVNGYTGALSLLNGAQAQIAIDTTDNAWVPAAFGNYKFTSGTAAGTLVGGAAGNTVLGGGIAVDATTNQYVVNNSNTGISQVGAQTSAGAAITGFPTTAAFANCGNDTRYVTLDSAGSIWTADANAIFNQFTYVCRYAKTGGAAVYSYLMPSNVGGTFSIPHFLATDAGDNLIFTEKNQSQLYKIAYNTTTANTGATAIATNTGSPIGVVVDGANTVWISNQSANGAGAGGIVQYNDSLTRISPSYFLGAGLTPSGLGPIAADPSGNVWTSGGTTLYEYVGIATPTVTPLVAAKTAKTTGTKP